ncbi:hypothetical protein RN001_010684 [Aquatica leii]|uniref:Uncharacterized protein n=1 Tax=Aquatica leii TaxID=1421715 RepID=A0AAN7QHP0_9COLE|nr:hypothetical protein RN001_010684 [Aquatica leii]
MTYFCCGGIRYIRTNTNTRTDLVAAVFGITLSMGRSMLPSMLPGVEAGRDAIYISRWFAYEALKFLEDRDEPRKRLMTKTDDILGNEEDIENNPKSQPDTTAPVSTQRPTKRAKKAVDNNASMMSSAFNIFSEAAKKMDNQPTKPNKIDLFFAYIAAKVNKYALAVQNSVQHVVFEIRIKADTGIYGWGALNLQQSNHWQNLPGVPIHSQQYHLQPLHPCHLPAPNYFQVH